MGKRMLAVLFVLMLVVFALTDSHVVMDTVSQVWKTLGAGRTVNVQAEISQFTFVQKEGFFRQYDFIEANGLAHVIMGTRWMNAVYKLGNGYLASADPQMDTSAHALSVLALDKELRDRGIAFVYVQAPKEVDRNDTALPNGFHDFSNQNANDFVQTLRAAQLPVLDLREQIEQEGLNLYDLFFNTDHHWTPDAGFWAFREIMAEFSARYGVAVEARVIDAAQYEREVYPGTFLGSHGKRTGRYFAGMDDMTLIKPKFETALAMYLPHRGEERIGTFEEVMFRRQNLEKENLFERNNYYTYLGANYENARFRNENALGKEKVLLVSDSFSMVVIPYFALAFQQVDTIDLRYYLEVETLLQYIDREKPDYLVMLYTAGSLSDKVLFGFGI